MTQQPRHRTAARPSAAARLSLPLSLPLSLLLFGAGCVAAQEVDNCATLLGSLSRELHFARALAPGQRSSFTCPREREAKAAVGASRRRVLNALGTPDWSGHSDDGEVVWSYSFRSRLDRETDAVRLAGAPELSFRFNALDQVAAMDCRLTR